MQKTKCLDTLLLSIRFFRIPLGVAVFFLLLASCDDSKRHGMMTFFFDGVPPAPGEAGSGTALDPNERRNTRPLTGGWYVHEPLQDCNECHGDRQRTFSRQIHLVAESPALCYKCHERETSSQGWVHGPVATGECLFCHEPHKARIAFLLKEPPPGLCYQCHEPEEIHLIERHAEESYADCLQCHEGHAGATKSLLLPSFLDSEEGRSYRSQVQRQQYEQALARGREEMADNGDPVAILQRAIDGMQDCQPAAARGYLEALIEGDSVTDDEKQRLSGVLREAASLQAGMAQESEDAQNERERLEAKCAGLADVLREIRDNRTAREREIAELYYRSINLYHAGRLKEAREGFRRVLGSASLPEAVAETARLYLQRIEGGLDEVQPPTRQPLR